MGLAYDANETVETSDVTSEMRLEEDERKSLGNENSNHESRATCAASAKNSVAEALEADAKVPRKRLLRLPKGQAELLTYLVKKYGEDYEVKHCR